MSITVEFLVLTPVKMEKEMGDDMEHRMIVGLQVLVGSFSIMCFEGPFCKSELEPAAGSLQP